MTTTKPPSGTKSEDVRRYRANLRDEVDGVALYRLLEDAEADPSLKQLYGRLAESEDKHRVLWERKLREAGAEVPAYSASRRVRILGWLARHFGTAAVSPIVSRMEMSATGMYDDQPEAIAEGLPAAEASHARLFREIARTGAGTAGAANIARVEGRHRFGAGNALRAAVLGVNDGLVSTLSLVFGVAGADPGRNVVFLTGIAGLLAGSLSMALGEWISVRSSAESFARQLRIESEELELMPEEEMEELALIYQSKGLSREDARQTARRILSDHTTALDTLAREELGMSPEEVGNAWTAGITSFLLFGVGGVIPVIPWAFTGGTLGVALSAVFAAFGLFAAGAVTSLFTGRAVWYSGSRMVLFGLAAAGITFGIGRLIGVSTGV